MNIKLHHFEVCVTELEKTVEMLEKQFGFRKVGKRQTPQIKQVVLQTSKTIFVINCKLSYTEGNIDENGNAPSDMGIACAKEPWTIFCCKEKFRNDEHIDSVFNIAVEVDDLASCLIKLRGLKCIFLHDETTVSDDNGSVTYAIVQSCCGNVVHTIIQKSDYKGWFLPGFNQNSQAIHEESADSLLPTYFDHVALACHVGGTNEIIKWYEEVFEMRRFLTNKQDNTENGLVIDGEVGMRLKVMEFWMCSEIGVESQQESFTKELLKIVVVESLANIRNKQIEDFLKYHEGPGIQHIGLHTSNITNTVEHLVSRDVKFRVPPATYYTEIGQLHAINSVGESVHLLKKYGILLDTEADVAEDTQSFHDRYLMQIFTYPIFDPRGTFFLEVIQRKGARGFGVGNVTALARSVNAEQHNQKPRAIITD